MFCPECRTEYREGYTKCTDCQVSLVADLPDLPPPPTAEYVDFEELLSTFNPMDIALIRSQLDAAGIKYYFLGELFYSMEPFLQPARLMVRTDQVGEARELVKDLDLKFSISLSGTPPSP
jgi:hypothetical protein